MGKVAEVAKLAQMTNKSFSYGFIEEQLPYDHSVKAFLDLFAYKHFQDLLIMAFKARVNLSTSLWVLKAEKLTLTVPSGNVPKAWCISGAQ